MPKSFKYFCYFLAIVLLLLVVFLLGFNTFLNSNKDNIIARLDHLHSGQIDFERISVDLLGNFPEVDLKLKEVSLKDSLYEQHQKELFGAEEIRGTLSLRHLLRKEIEFKSVYLGNGHLSVFTETNAYNNLNAFIGGAAKESKDVSSGNMKFNADQTIVVLENMEVDILNKPANQKMTGLVKYLESNHQQSSCSLTNIVLSDSLSQEEDKDLVHIASINTTALFDRSSFEEIQLQSLELSNGIVHLITEEDGSNNLQRFLSILRNKKENIANSNISKHNIKFSLVEGVEIDIEELGIDFINNLKDQQIIARLDQAIIADENANLFLSDVSVKDSLFVKHQKELLAFQNVNVGLSFDKLLENQVRINKIEGEKGAFQMFVQGKYSNLKNLLKQGNKRKILVNEFLDETVEIDLKDFDFLQLHKYKQVNQRIAAHFPKLKGNLEVAKDEIKIGVSMLAAVEEMGFNLNRGRFFKGANLEGQLETVLDLRRKKMQILPCQLKVNDQEIGLRSTIDLSQKETSYVFDLNIPQTNYKTALPLLSEPLQEILNVFEFKEEFYTHTNIVGTFTPGDIARVKVDFKTEENQFAYEDYTVKNLKTEGSLINKLYDDERADNEPRENFRLVFDNLSGAYEDINFEAKEVLYKNSPDSTSFIDFEVNANGKPASLSRLLNNDKFLFSEGDFNLDLSYNGEMESIKDLIVLSEADVEFTGVNVLYKPAEVVFPIESLVVNKQAGDANFKLVSNTIGQSNRYTVEGDLKDFPALLLDQIEGQPTSNVAFSANTISWEDFVALFGKGGVFTNEENTPVDKKESIKRLKKVVGGFYESFEPFVSIKVDTFIYTDNFEIHNFHSSAHYNNATELVLEETCFEYEEGKLDLNGTIDISSPIETPFEIEIKTKGVNVSKLMPAFNYFNIAYFENLDTLPENVGLNIKHKGIYEDFVGLVPNTSTGQINFNMDNGETIMGMIAYQPDYARSNEEDLGVFHARTNVKVIGKPEVLSTIFQNDEFFFQKGEFLVDFDYTGDVTTLDELIGESVTYFELKDSEVFYKTAGITLPISDLSLNIDKNIADFSLFMYSDEIDEEIKFEGQLENFTSLLLSENKEVTTNVLISSPHLQWVHFIALFETEGLIPEQNQHRSGGFKKTITGLSKTFNPTVKVKVDTAVYDDNLEFHNLETGAYFNDNNDLVLDKTTFNYEKGNVELQALFNLDDLHRTPFSTSFKTQQIDVGKLIKSFDYFNVRTLQEIEKMTGEVTLDVQLEGLVQDTSGLILESTKGIVYFDLQNVQVKGFKSLEKIASKVFRKSRFEDIFFAPITNILLINGDDIEIPQMEIQSTAMDMFLEGDFSYNNNTNIWISVPLSNVKQPEGLTLPNQHNYALGGRKIYIEIFTNKKRETVFKFHLTKKKFYKQRGIKEQYKIEKKKNRTIRQNYRKLKKALKQKQN